METRAIPLHLIKISGANIRKDMDAGNEDTSLEDLAQSILQHGLLNPVTVRTLPSGQYELVAGQRRFLACRQLGLPTIAAIVRDDLDDSTATVVSLIENVQRADASPLDKARAYQALYTQYGDYARVARATSVSVSTIRRYLSLLKLDPAIRPKLTTSDGPAGIGTLSKLAETTPQAQQAQVLQAIDGFKQGIQQKILAQGRGDLHKIVALRDQALEGAFDMRTCSEGLCFELPDKLKSQIRIRIARDERITLADVP